MADVQAFLTRKAGPLPVWGWAAIGGGLVSVLYLRGRSQASATAADQNADTSTGSPFASPLIFRPASFSDGSSSATPAATPATVPPPNWQFGSPPADKSTWVWHPTSVGASSYQRATGQAWPGGVYPGTTNPDAILGGAGAGAYSWQWASVPDGYTAPSYAAALALAGLGGGGGGNSEMVTTAPGAGTVARFASPQAAPQYVPTGMGGGGPSGLRAVARQTGLPVARVMALNPGHWRGGRPPAAIHIR